MCSGCVGSERAGASHVGETASPASATPSSRTGGRSCTTCGTVDLHLLELEGGRGRRREGELAVEHKSMGPTSAYARLSTRIYLSGLEERASLLLRTMALIEVG